MAEGFEMAEFGRTDDKLIKELQQDIDEDWETPLNASPERVHIIQRLESELAQYAGKSLEEQRKELLTTKVDAFLKAVLEKYGLYPINDFVYQEFELGADGVTLYLKDGHKRVTALQDTTKFLDLKKLAPASFIRTHLFPSYSTTVSPIAPPRVKKALAKIKQTTEQAAVESTELADLPQRAADVDTEVKRLFAEDVTTLPVRELLGLDKALQRQRGSLVDNLAKLTILDADIAATEDDLGGEEAANDPEKKRRIEDLLQRLRDERSTRLEAAAANRDALRTQFSRIRETIERILNEDTPLAERLRALFREQGVTIASILTAFGFIVSTIVLAIQNTLGGGGTPPAPAPPSDGVTAWVKKQLKTLAGWLKALAGKAAVALPGVIGAIVSWLLKTAGSVAVWLAEHLWALATALIVAAAVWLRDYRTR